MKVKALGVVAVIFCLVGLALVFLQLKPESLEHRGSTNSEISQPVPKFVSESQDANSEILIIDVETGEFSSHDTEGFVEVGIEDLKSMSLSELEFYLSDFRWAMHKLDGFEQAEVDLLMAVFEFNPEVVMSYVSEYYLLSEDAQLVPPKIVAALRYETSEALLKEGFNRYLDVYQSLPVSWLVAGALQSEMTEFFNTGNIQAVPPIVSEYALNDFLNGKVNQYPFAVSLNPPGTITDEQLIEMFLSASPKTIDTGMDELIFDVIALNDIRTYSHLLECLKYQPKKLNIYRQLKDVEGLEIRETINEAMASLEALSEQDKVYFSLMALDYGDIRAFDYLLKNPDKNFSGPVDVNIEFVLKRKIAPPVGGIENVIKWAQEHAAEFQFDSILNKFFI